MSLQYEDLILAPMLENSVTLCHARVRNLRSPASNLVSRAHLPSSSRGVGVASQAYIQTTQEHNLRWFLLHMLLLFSQMIVELDFEELSHSSLLNSSEK